MTDIVERLTDYHRGCTSEMRQEAAEEIERLQEEIDKIKEQAEDATEYVLAQINADLNAEIERLRQASKWQPIETAPRDRWILVITGTWIDVVRWSHMRERFERLTTAEYDNDFADVGSPTAWMPLPNPPWREESDD